MSEEIEKLKSRIRGLEEEILAYKRYCGEEPNHQMKEWVYNVKRALPPSSYAQVAAALLVAMASRGSQLISKASIALGVESCVTSKGSDDCRSQVHTRVCSARKLLQGCGFAGADIINHHGAGYQLSPRLYAWVLARKPEKKLEIL